MATRIARFRARRRRRGGGRGGGVAVPGLADRPTGCALPRDGPAGRPGRYCRVPPNDAALWSSWPASSTPPPLGVDAERAFSFELGGGLYPPVGCPRHDPSHRRRRRSGSLCRSGCLPASGCSVSGASSACDPDVPRSRPCRTCRRGRLRPRRRPLWPSACATWMPPPGRAALRPSNCRRGAWRPGADHRPWRRRAAGLRMSSCTTGCRHASCFDLAPPDADIDVGKSSDGSVHSRKSPHQRPAGRTRPPGPDGGGSGVWRPVRVLPAAPRRGRRCRRRRRLRGRPRHHLPRPVPAYAGIPVTLRYRRPASRRPGHEDLRAAAPTSAGGAARVGTIVVLDGGAQPPRIAERSVAGGSPRHACRGHPVGTRPPSRPSAYAQHPWADHDLASPATIVIGDVAGERLTGSERRPLLGWTVVVTRTWTSRRSSPAAPRRQCRGARAPTIAVETRGRGAALRDAVSRFHLRLGGAHPPNGARPVRRRAVRRSGPGWGSVAVIGPGTAVAIADKHASPPIWSLTSWPSRCSTPSSTCRPAVHGCLARARSLSDVLPGRVGRPGWDVEVVEAYRDRRRLLRRRATRSWCVPRRRGCSRSSPDRRALYCRPRRTRCRRGRSPARSPGIGLGHRGDRLASWFGPERCTGDSWIDGPVDASRRTPCPASVSAVRLAGRTSAERRGPRAGCRRRFDFDGLVLDTEWCGVRHRRRAVPGARHRAEPGPVEESIGTVDHPHWTDIPRGSRRRSTVSFRSSRPASPPRDVRNADLALPSGVVLPVDLLRDCAGSRWRRRRRSITSTATDTTACSDRFPVRATATRFPLTPPDPAVYLLVRANGSACGPGPRSRSRTRSTG